MYCRNNPLRYIDPDGLKLTLSDEFQENEKLMAAFNEWKNNSEEKYNLMMKK